MEYAYTYPSQLSAYRRAGRVLTFRFGMSSLLIAYKMLPHAYVAFVCADRFHRTTTFSSDLLKNVLGCRLCFMGFIFQLNDLELLLILTHVPYLFGPTREPMLPTQ